MSDGTPHKASFLLAAVRRLADQQPQQPQQQESVSKLLWLDAMNKRWGDGERSPIGSLVRQPPLRMPLSTYKSLQSYLDLCPRELTSLELHNANITTKSLQGVRFPPGLKELNLEQNQITSLDGVQFPPGLTELALMQNQIWSLSGVKFPRGLKRLDLSDNEISTLSGTEFPPNLEELDLEGNPLRDLGTAIDNTQMINPNKYVIEYLKRNFAQLYFRDLYEHHKYSKIAEKAELKAARQSQKAEFKAARQSQKAELKQTSDLTQQSVQNQLKAVTSFLREGMAARAMEHDENIRTKRKGSDIFVRLANGTLYHVPYAKEMTVQHVLDYLNEHYYISVLNPNHGVVRLMFNNEQLDPSRTLASYDVENEATLHATPRYIGQGGGKRRIATRSKRSKKQRKSKKRT